MSSVRMCDRCGNIFSETEDGWQTFTATTRQRDPKSKQWQTVQAVLDACSSCAIGGEPLAGNRPMIAPGRGLSPESVIPSASATG